MTTHAKKASSPEHHSEHENSNSHADQVKEAASTLAAEAAKLIKKHPLPAVTTAFVVGLIAGWLLKRRDS